MKKKLVFLALALVLILACAATASAAGRNWYNERNFVSSKVSAWTFIGDKITVNKEEKKILNVRLLAEPTCTEPAKWALIWAVDGNKESYDVGYFWDGNQRHMDHVYTSETAWDGVQSYEAVKDANGVTTYVYTLKNGTKVTLYGEAIIKLPTCTTTGEAYEFCVYCGKVNTKGKTMVPKLAHWWKSTLVKLPTCVNKNVGVAVDVCENCGAHKKDTAGKDIETEVTLAQALADPNYKAQLDAAGITADGHKWDGWANGNTVCEHKRHCLLCKTPQIQVDDPKWTVAEAVIIDCYEVKELRVCAVCNGAQDGHKGYFYETSAKRLADSGDPTLTVEDFAFHKLVEDDAHRLGYAKKGGTTLYASIAKMIEGEGLTSQSVCEVPYDVYYKCDRDASHTIKISKGPNGHDWKAWDLNYAPGTKDNAEGMWTRQCKVCGATEEYFGTKEPAANYVAYVADVENGFQFKNGTWGWYANGNLQNGMNTLVPYMTGWFVVVDGKWDTSYEGLYTYDGAQFYVSGGQVRNDLQGFVNTKTGFLYFADGMLQKVTTLVQYDGAWFYIVDGKLAADYTGPVTYDGAVFNVVGGQVQ